MLCLKLRFIRNSLTNQFIGIHIGNGNRNMLTCFRTNLKTFVLKRTIKQALLIECSGGLNTVNLAHQLFYFCLDVRTIY